MGLQIGTTKLPLAVGRPNRLAANGNDTEWMPIGVTIAWDLIAANAGATAFAVDGTPIYNGEKIIEIGTYMVPLTGGPSKGQFAPFTDGAANGQGVKSPDGGFLDMTIKQGEFDSDLKGLIVGGTVWRERLKLVTNLAIADIRALFPRLRITAPETGF